MDDIFAEIEMSEVPTRKSSGDAWQWGGETTNANSNAVKDVSMGESGDVPIIAQKIDDSCPARKMFYEMRALASDNPYEWSYARLFYRQGKFMENFTDDYAGQAEFSMHSPCYQRMGYERLRTYFTWRTAFRDAVFPPPPPSVSYIFLYIYELLLCIGEKTPADALARLYVVRDAYVGEFPALEKHLKLWLRDFRVYYGVELEGSNAALRRSDFIFSESCGLLAWNKISAYNVEKSKFYAESEANALLLGDAFLAALGGMAELCRAKGIVLRDLFMLTGKQEIPWTPFSGAMFHPWLRQPDRKVELPGGEVYVCRNDEWKTLHHTPYAHNKDLAAFFIKKTESLTREACDFAKLSVDIAALAKARGSLGGICGRGGISAEEIEFVITRAVTEFFKEKNRVVVNVDVSNLTRIREEADDITEKLVVDEESVRENRVVESRPQLHGDSQVEHEFSSIPVSAPSHLLSFSLPLPEKSPFSTIPFTPTEIDALKIITASNGDIGKIKAFADSKGVMLEILVDGINEKSMDTIGDNLLDFGDTITMYEEYLNDMAFLQNV